MSNILGTKWIDFNDNKIFDSGELTMVGVTIFLDLNNNQVLDADEPSTVTDETGQYEFTGLEAGTYIVRELVPDGFVQIFPTSGIGFADVVLDYFDSGAGPIPGPYGGGTPIEPVSLDIILGNDKDGFLSLPTDSFVTVGFTDEEGIDGPGDDIFVLEAGAAGDQADIFVSSNLIDFTFIGTGNGGETSSFDLVDIGFTDPVRAIKIVGLNNAGTAPGFDVINVQVLPESIQEVTGAHTVTLLENQVVEGLNFGNDGPPPSFSVNNVTVTEGQTANFTVSLSTPVGSDVTVDFTTNDNSATDNEDYTLNSGTVTIPAGETQATISVETTDDSVIEEEDESFTVKLFDSSFGTSWINIPSIGTIQDNDQVVISISDAATVTEGENATFTVSLDQPATTDVTVEFATSDESARAGEDYTGNSATATIAAGDTQTTISVETTDDTEIAEGDETFNLTLANANGGIIEDGTAVGTIQDNDAAPVPNISISEAATVTEGETTSFTVSLDQPATTDVTVEFATSDNSATGGEDYIPNSATVTIPAGGTETTISVETTDDSEIAEPDETFNVTLSNANGAVIENATAVGTIQDNDEAPIPNISISDAATVTEGETATFTVRLDQPATTDVTVEFATSNDSATAEADYTPNSATVAIPAGETEATISVETTDDSEIAEPDETFNVTLSNANGATIADNTGIGTIKDNDEEVVVSNNISIANAAPVLEGYTTNFTVSLEQPATEDVTVSYATSDGSATQPEDYTETSGTITIPTGSTQGNITVPTVFDAEQNEADETFNVTLSNPINGAIANSTATGTIQENNGVELPDLLISKLVAESPAFTGQEAQFTYKVENQGLATLAETWVDKIYLSTDEQLDTEDELLSEFEISANIQVGQF